MYDKEQIYDEQIAPLMSKIIEICKVNGIQVLASFFLKEKTEDQGNMFCTTCLVPNEGNKRLSNAANVILFGHEVHKPFLMAMTVTKEG